MKIFMITPFPDVIHSFMKTIKEGIGDDNQNTRYSTASPFSHQKYIDDITNARKYMW